jgi:putative transposase
MCKLYGVSKSGFYAWQTRPESKHQKYDTFLKSLITELHQGFRRSYGAARMHQELIQRGYQCSKRRINRLMREMGVKASSTGLYVWRPGFHEFYSSTPNQLKKENVADSKGQHWAGDFTYIRTHSGWLYFAVVLDLYHRKVIGWSFSRLRNTKLTKSALRMALLRERPQKGCLFHSDQGVEYAAHEYRDMLFEAGLRRSMSRRGNPIDNAKVESFFHTYKTELVRRRIFTNEIEAVAESVEYIDFYNRKRLHSSLNFQSPINYERLYA